VWVFGGLGFWGGGGFFESLPHSIVLSSKENVIIMLTSHISIMGDKPEGVYMI